MTRTSGGCSGLWGLFLEQVRIEFTGTVGTDAMAEVNCRPVTDIFLNVMPARIAIPDFFTGGTYREYTFQILHLLKETAGD